MVRCGCMAENWVLQYSWIANSYEIPQPVEVKGGWSRKFGTWIFFGKVKEADGNKHRSHWLSLKVRITI